MENEKNQPEIKPLYVKPEILASYQKSELEKIIRPHGTPDTTGGGGCGGGSILID